MSYAKEIARARQMVARVFKIAKELRNGLEPSDVIYKEDLSPVTLADFVVQGFVKYSLAQDFPMDPILAEETSAPLREGRAALLKRHVVTELQRHLFLSDEEEVLAQIDRASLTHAAWEKMPPRFWVLDPIDGTRGFIRKEKEESYAIALALLEAGEVKVALLACSCLDLEGFFDGGLFIAEQGQGCRLYLFHPTDSEELPIHVSTWDPDSPLCYCEPPASSQTHAHLSAWHLVQQLGTPHPIPLDSQCKYGHVASGAVPLYLRMPTPAHSGKEKSWDHAAGMLVVQEAGGKVTDLDGKPLDFTQGATLTGNRGVLVTNGELHTRLLKTIQILKI